MIRRLKGEEVQALIEWAFVMPLLVFLTLGIMVMAVLINTKLATSGAAREAARNYAIYKNSQRAACRAGDYLHGTLLAGTVASCKETAGGGVQWGTGERCQVSYFGTNMPQVITSVPCSVDIAVPSGGDTVEVRVTFWQNVFVPGLYRLLSGNERLTPGNMALPDRTPISSSVVFRLEQP